MPFYIFNTPTGIVKHVCTQHTSIRGYANRAGATSLIVEGIAGPDGEFYKFAKHVTPAVLRSWHVLCKDAGVRAALGAQGATTYLGFNLPLTGVDARSAHNQFQFWRQIVERPKEAAKVARLWWRIRSHQKEDHRGRIAKALWAYYFGGRGHSIVAASAQRPRELVYFLDTPMHRQGEFSWSSWTSLNAGYGVPTKAQLLVCDRMWTGGVTLGQWMRAMAPGTVLRPKRSQAQLEDWYEY